MKNLFLLVTIFSFCVVSFTLAVSPVSETVEVSHQRAVEATERVRVGHERAVEAIETSIRRMEDRGTNMNTERLREVLTLLLSKTESDFCHDFEVEIRYKDESDEVESLQEALRREGHFQSRLDSYYGWDLAKAVYDYQNENEINPQSDLEKMGFVLSEETRDYLNYKYSCSDEDSTENEKTDNDSKD